MNLNPYLIQGPALISFSGGRTSAYMLHEIIRAHGGTLPDYLKVAFANTGREMDETLDFVQQCASRWGVHITWLEYDPAEPQKTRIVSHNSASRNGEPFAAVIKDRKFLPNPVTRFCTIELKIRRFREFCVHHLGWSHWISVVGLRADEKGRIAKQLKRNRAGKDRWKTITPLFYAGVTKQTVADFWKAQPFDLKLPNINGKTPEGNCDLCFLKGAATTRGIMRRHPDRARWWIEQEMNAPGFGKYANPEVALFCKDRPSYAQLLEQSRIDLFDGIDEDEGSIDCACTE